MSDLIEYISSTQLRQYNDCPRKWAFQHVDKKSPPQASRAMAFGTIVHHILEYKLIYGRWPNKRAIEIAQGNYDNPGKYLRIHSNLWSEAIACARAVEPAQYIGEGQYYLEKALADYGLTLCGIPVRGYIDVLQLTERTIIDWKTRGSFRYAPKYPKDFRGDIQLCFYAATVARVEDWPDVTVRHVNINRNTHEVMVCEHTIDRWYLDAFWDFLETERVPEMIATAEAAVVDRERDVSKCWMYGRPCPYQTICPSTAEAAYTDDPLGHILADEEETMKVNSDEAPPNVQPVPFRARSVQVLKDFKYIKKNQLESLHDAGLFRLGQLEDMPPDDIAALPGFGAKSVEKVLDGLRDQKAVGGAK